MNRLPSNLMGREVFVILKAGGELEGKCTLAREDYLILRIGFWEYTIEAEAIAAVGVNREKEVKALSPPASPFCFWEEYQRTGAYLDMLRWLKHRAYCYAVVQPEGYPELFRSVAATPEQIDHEAGWIELRRAPGSCCPEPSCDYASHDGQHCGMCGHACDECRRKG